MFKTLSILRIHGPKKYINVRMFSGGRKGSSMDYMNQIKKQQKLKQEEKEHKEESHTLSDILTDPGAIE